MTREEAKRRLLNIERSIPNTFRTKEDVRNFEALEMAIQALELLDTLTERPCDVCEHHKEKGCCKWNCVFDGYIK